MKDQLDALSYEIRGAAMEVYNHFGPGLLESLYESALIVELQSRDIKVESQVPDKQLRSYLKLMNKPLGWLINFNEHDFAHGMVKVPNRFYNP